MSWLLIAFPIVCAFIGLFTNWLAIKMMFRPVERKRIFGPFYWQGIIPANFPKFAKLVSNVLENEIIQMDDITRAIDIKSQLEKNKDNIFKLIEQFYIENKDQVPEQYRSIVNEQTLPVFQQTVYQHMLEEAPKALKMFMDYGQEKIGIRNFILDRTMKQDRSLLEKLTFSVAKREINFIIYYGGIFGGILGFLQYFLYQVGAPLWIMPVMGVFIGSLTNSLALLMMWAPREPKKFLGFTFQGALPGRGDELLESVQQIVATDFLVLGEMIALLVDQISEEIIAQTFDYQTEKAIPKNIPQAGQILEQVVPDQQKEEIKAWVVKNVMASLPQVKEQIQVYVDKEFDLYEIMRSKEQATIDEFIDFLLAIMTHEQLVLIAYGGLLGGLIGLAQISLL